MAYPQHFGSFQPTAFSGFPQQQYYTSFAPQQQQQFAVADHASQHEGSQAGEAHAQSVSGFAAQPIDAGFGGFYGFPQQGFAQQAFPQQATFIQGAPQHTVLPAHYGQATILPAQYGQVVPAQVIRRPGYNERLVAWRNRQKAFNRYKRSTKEAIKNSNHTQYQQHFAAPQQTFLAPSYGAATAYGAAPAYGQTYIAQQGAFPAYGQTYLAGGQYFGGFPQQAVYAGEVQDGQEQQYGDFTSYSSAGVNAAEVQQEEPEIRGTQV